MEDTEIVKSLDDINDSIKAGFDDVVEMVHSFALILEKLEQTLYQAELK